MKIGFIGCGNMAGAILSCILEKNVIECEDIIVFDPSEAAIKKVDSLGIHMAKDITELCEKSDMLLLGVKPNKIKSVFADAKDAIKGKALMSIAAGVPVSKLREYAYAKLRILRIMPNAPAMVGAGAMALCTDTDFTAEEREVAIRLMEAVGAVVWTDEYLMNAVTGLSGSGPAYVAMFIEALADGGVKNGLSRESATKLAAQTVYGTAKMLIEKDMHPGQLKDMVCSPGGTTIDGVDALEKGAFRHTAMEAVTAATQKAGQLV